MKRLLPFVLCLFLFSACDKDNEELPSVPQYVLTSIEYSLEEGDGVQSELVDGMPRVIDNDTPSKMTYTNSDEEYLKNESLFQSDDVNAFLLAEGDSVKVPTPSEIVDGKIFTTKGNLYTDMVQYSATGQVLASSIVISAYCRLTYKWKQKWDVMTVTYVVTFKDKVTGSQKQSKGKWKGRIYRGGDRTFHFENIKE
ncbi:hypothetical protein H8784_15565 [Parabacteroides acidifaciens]|uniref:Uncharacterized protein n=1 Tax=Parabacteroides acidifaciens TaxID=2290935 RepID=A0A3D8HAW4_9BACT|nr:hypothetical protein [Parabacteroides acidifaciens]MBC8603131.1 hypothetical protein [Parabacteroides acidifaciens]RDU48135.1 hypothetical protein DWU89_15940 [Parabacteroides acidifaciens]